MKKALAFVIGIILVTCTCFIPFADAFAADPGISPYLFNACFSWFSDEPGVDANGLYYGSAMSDGTSSSGTYSFGQQINLLSEGSYISWNFETGMMDFTSPVAFISIFWDLSYSCPTSNFKYEIYPKNAPALSFDIFYQYDQPLITVDGRQYRRTNILFDHNNVAPGAITIKVSADIDNGGFGNTIPLAFMYGGYRASSQTYTQTELIQLQSNIINALNMARLADFAGLDSSNVDLSTIESSLSSLYTLLDDNLDTVIESLSETNGYLSDSVYYLDEMQIVLENFYNTFYSEHRFTNYNQYVSNIYNSDFIKQTSIFTDDSIYFGISLSGSGPFYLKTHFHFIEQLSYDDIESITYTLQMSLNLNSAQWLDNTSYYVINYSGGTDVFIFLESERPLNANYIIYNFTFSDDVTIRTSSTYYSYYFNQTSMRFYDVVLQYLKQLLYGSLDSQTVTDVNNMADDIQQSADTVNEFHVSAQTSVNDNLQQIDTSLYPIGGTGLTYMKTYTQNMFEASNGFRIWFMLPLILATIGLLVRWRTPK